jgi:hypothetical protein
MLKPRWRRRTISGEQEGSTEQQEATDAAPPLQDDVHIRESLEVIKTAVVWLVVINILTVLSPLLRLPLKWRLVVGVILAVGSAVIGYMAYLRARAAQSRLPE